MKKLASIIFFVSISLAVIAQQDPKLSQNMFLVPVFNPGAMGQSDMICAAASFRNQWAGFPGAPVVSTFTAHAPFSLFGRSHGVGINLMNDNVALNNDLFVSAAYSYKIDFGSGVLGIGLNAGFANHSFDPSGLNGADVIDITGDDAIPQNAASLFGFDMGAGAYYSTDKLYFGLSTTHLNQTSFDFPEELAETRLIRHYYAVGGYTIQLPNPTFELIPSFMLQTDTKDHHIYLNTNVRYNKRFWGGVSYSVGGAVSALFGIELMNGIKVGYSYDIELSPLFKYSSGSHEVTVRYCFDLSLDKSPQKYESIRFL
ncbi:MAG: type IX secretion system membrane protein PorP/SprF [Bacteroidales bacterium]|nr:type IX secretion system membrane protein PorP/SprF [Bacteroidales bacterium]MDT8430651.1 type IX secretion system membrane protein PorP/SprF [Bacteroidales bacterium]